jgi:hypothetical protein
MRTGVWALPLPEDRLGSTLVEAAAFAVLGRSP